MHRRAVGELLMIDTLDGLANRLGRIMACLVVAAAVAAEEPIPRNLPEREEWFSDLAIGMFIHWCVDSQLGSVISHTLVGSSEDYANRFFTELPQTFDPKQFDPADWARLARVAGMRYVMFTAKHHSGFCMFDTETTEFSIMHTPFARDITREIVEAFRGEGIAPGLYFSPEDFWVLHRQGHEIARLLPYTLPANNPELTEHNRRQLRELFTNYGPIELAFLDSVDGVDAVRTIWEIDRNVTITRGVMETPEQKTPDAPLPSPWEACYTLGTQWQFKPTNETYKSGTQLIEMLIEIRAKGGNLLLNVGPEPSGVIPFEQERILRELALWLFVNGEAIYEVRPWHVIREGDVWFTKGKDENTLYAFLTKQHPWKRGERREFVLTSARATDSTEIAVLGHGGTVVEYQPETDATPRVEQREDGLHVSVVRGQRLYNNMQWPNPVVVRLTNVEPARLD
jgi:alpha-L-fucosidase